MACSHWLEAARKWTALQRAQARPGASIKARTRLLRCMAMAAPREPSHPRVRPRAPGAGQVSPPCTLRSQARPDRAIALQPSARILPRTPVAAVGTERAFALLLADARPRGRKPRASSHRAAAGEGIWVVVW